MTLEFSALLQNNEFNISYYVLLKIENKFSKYAQILIPIVHIH